MSDNLPIKKLIQLDDVTIFQTAAFSRMDTELSDSSQQRHQIGQANYGELNLGLHVNDDAANVLLNRMRLLAAINEQLSEGSVVHKKLSNENLVNQHKKVGKPTSIKKMHWVNQVHGKHVHNVDTTSLTMRPVDADAMVSQQVGVSLAIMTADCVPIVLYQPSSQKIAAIHAGWQGLACGIIQATAKCFDTAEPVMAWIGVCISQAHYEVNVPIRDKLLAGCKDNQSLSPSDLDNFDQRYVTASNDGADVNGNKLDKRIENISHCATLSTDKLSNNKVKLNLSMLAQSQLEHVGISVVNNELMGCSYADTDYYSYRRQTHFQQPATGRMALIITRSHSQY